MAHNVGPETWIISLFQDETVAIICNNQESYIPVVSPWQVVRIPDGCSAYTPSLRIPAYTKIESVQNETFERLYEGFNRTFIPLKDFRMLQEIPIPGVDETNLRFKAEQLPPMKNVLQGRIIAALEQIDNEYPFSMPEWLVVLLSIFGTISAITFILLLACCCSQRTVGRHQTRRPRTPPQLEFPPPPPLTTKPPSTSKNPAVYVAAEGEVCPFSPRNNRNLTPPEYSPSRSSTKGRSIHDEPLPLTPLEESDAPPKMAKTKIGKVLNGIREKTDKTGARKTKHKVTKSVGDMDFQDLGDLAKSLDMLTNLNGEHQLLPSISGLADLNGGHPLLPPTDGNQSD